MSVGICRGEDERLIQPGVFSDGGMLAPSLVVLDGISLTNFVSYAKLVILQIPVLLTNTFSNLMPL
jgi:hypothetical protein